MPIQNLLTVAVIFALIALFMLFKDRILGALKRFDARNTARRSEEARALLSKLVDAEQTVIATTPNVDFPQGTWAGNEAETHRCKLEASDFPHLIAKMKTGVTTCFVCSRRPDHVEIIRECASRSPTFKEERFPVTTDRFRRLVKRLNNGKWSKVIIIC